MSSPVVVSFEGIRSNGWRCQSSFASSPSMWTNSWAISPASPLSSKQWKFYHIYWLFFLWAGLLCLLPFLEFSLLWMFDLTEFCETRVPFRYKAFLLRLWGIPWLAFKLRAVWETMTTFQQECETLRLLEFRREFNSRKRCNLPWFHYRNFSFLDPCWQAR